ncbi:GPP34 family phosphoprotein [Mycobacterium heckeshornense]|uniref:Uncharacterized protein n=1 Tax=Mycobacterium heckeshornense TaxID=110505 RepID=A0A2G8B9F2_9MYCO|nr:GPP34 family phosphoprotein [Mycobacterium heckeshornense]KMV21433.1 hypothetical protein ACT16_16550 [Mycobacterium heckeshornense]MCV7034134.1 GPP34 family phosphoprotein [Mycobacterium heckeshornense]PIJ34364.1 GPP34 family phosphoprotein [Mycobacterium heckeshornense]BCO34721.1 hypothetical protein MHEC_11540 [Mycobacterium heckeshornense]BCQ07895.1 hypothetical protein JMUB5695_01320 [Mycobacterium heckeshornense]
MAKIAEDLLLLLLDNASGQPALDRTRRGRLLAAAVLLDLAYACRIRPAVDGDPVQTRRLLVLTGPDPGDPAVAPALRLLLRRPLSPAAAIAKLRRETPALVLSQLERGGHVQRVQLYAKGFKPAYGWRLTDRHRVSQTRAAMTAALFDRLCPDPAAATIISLLHAIGGLGAVFSLDDRGWDWVLSRAGDIASGCWVNESEPGLPEVNLAVTTAAIRPALT